jgi:hypothetical protein
VTVASKPKKFLGTGFGIRVALESKKQGWQPLSEFARVWQPSRLKGIQVSSSFGTPFFGATQVFDLRPTPRKFLALERTENSADRFVSSGTILVTCSGSVGRATLAHRSHEGVLVSHDLLRIEPTNKDYWGWIYAYLLAPKTRAMMKAAQYGHIIKHLEVSHLNPMPVPSVNEHWRIQFQQWATSILNGRARSSELTSQAEAIFENAFPTISNRKKGYDLGFAVSASAILKSGKRFEASRFEPSVDQVLRAFKRDAEDLVPLSEVTTRVFVPGRFKHIYGDGGTAYLDSADILEVNPDIKKYVLSLTNKEQEEYRVLPGWLLIPCSGQVYGNIGHSVLATQWHVGKVLTNHIMRVCPSPIIRSGYLLCALGHPLLGRKQLVRFAFGSSVPEIAPEDIVTALVPRLKRKTEERIADLMEEAAGARDTADELEVKIAREADHLIDQFLLGDSSMIEDAP